MAMSEAAPRPRPTLLDWGLLALLGLIWGGAFLGVELSLDSLAPLQVSTARIVLAAMLLIAVAFLAGDGLPGFATPLQRRIWLHCLGMGLFTNAIPFTLLAWGQQLVTSGFAGITMAVVPLLVLPLSHFLIPGERMTVARLAGFGIGFAGVVLLIGGGRIFTGMSTDPVDHDGTARLRSGKLLLCDRCHHHTPVSAGQHNILCRCRPALCQHCPDPHYAADRRYAIIDQPAGAGRNAVSGPAANRAGDHFADGDHQAGRATLSVSGELSGACLGRDFWRCHSWRGPARAFHHGVGGDPYRAGHFTVSGA